MEGRRRSQPPSPRRWPRASPPLPLPLRRRKGTESAKEAGTRRESAPVPLLPPLPPGRTRQRRRRPPRRRRGLAPPQLAPFGLVVGEAGPERFRFRRRRRRLQIPRLRVFGARPRRQARGVAAAAGQEQKEERSALLLRKAAPARSRNRSRRRRRRRRRGRRLGPCSIPSPADLDRRGRSQDSSRHPDGRRLVPGVEGTTTVERRRGEPLGLGAGRRREGRRGLAVEGAAPEGALDGGGFDGEEGRKKGLLRAPATGRSFERRNRVFFSFFLQKSKVKMRSLFFLSTQRLIAFLSPKVNKKEQIKHTNEK